MIYDSHLVTQVPFARSIGIPFSQLARHEIGLPMVANVISLGAICAITKIVSEEALTKIVIKRSPRGTEEKNMAGFAARSEGRQGSIGRIKTVTERTLLMIKPDAVQRNLIGKITDRLEIAGFKVVELKMVHL